MPEDLTGDEYDLWPDNATPVALFCDVSTQWRVGPGGIVGLDYGPLFHRMDRMQLSPQDYEALFQDLRIAESEAITAMRTEE